LIYDNLKKEAISYNYNVLNYFAVKTKQNRYRMYCRFPSSHSTSYVCIGRPATMMEIDCQLPNMPERDLHVTSPKFIAVSRLTTNRRAQFQVLNTPSMIAMEHHTMEQQLTASSPRKWHTSTNDIMLSNVSMTRISCTTLDPYHVHPLDDVPDEKIPPKAPYFMCPNTSLLQMERDSHPKPKAWLGPSKEWSTLLLHEPIPELFHSMYSNQKPKTNFWHNCTTPLDQQQCWANSYNATAIDEPWENFT